MRRSHLLRGKLVCLYYMGLAALLPAVPSKAEIPLFGFTDEVAQGGLGERGYVQFGYSYDPSGKHYTGYLFDDAIRTVNDVGTTFTATLSSANFAQFVNYLTDGSKEDLGWSVSEGADGSFGAGKTSDESHWIFGHNRDPRVDLHGDTISRVTLTLDSWGAVDVGSEAFTQVRFTVMCYGRGPVVGNFTDFTPEPSLWLPAAGSVALLVRRRR